MFGKSTILSALVSTVSAGTIIWDGRFNDMTTSADLGKWSWATPVGAYQYYIHGSGTVDKYVNLDSSYKNPADTGSKQGVKITIDQTAKWKGQTMLRTELIPQTKATINKGTTYYHFSIKTSKDNAPTTANEHQIAFFESHFTELKYGGQAGNTKLQWHVGGVSKWDVELVADQWHNVAYEINFDAGSVTFWHSTGSNPLTKTAGPFTASTSSNGADWHLGVLRLPVSSDEKGAEDWYFSGVYIESGELTTSVNSPGGSGEAEKPVASSAAIIASTVAAPSATSSAPAVVATPLASSTAAPMKTPIASSTRLLASSTFQTSFIPAPTPTNSAGTGSGSGSDSSTALPEKFTLKQFISWLKAKQGIN
ncbi:hypothetical protein GQ44DRAFT_666975 [Phaeosphaeriaceae sp. PMI808]|nr:hypothetical protein GQ44DRAFT_666975 [Phaeosphaeriaceae sp. PMI808]